MKNKIIFLFSLYLYIHSYNLQCNKIYSETPFSPYHCSGLNISIDGDTHCCLWKFYDDDAKENVTRCSSLDSEQFQNLTKYIQKKITKDNYTNLEIQCADQETLYCSNILFDQESINDCNKLKIYDKSDSYCCRWKFNDKKNNNKRNDYCASITEYQYITIEEYVKYKEGKTNSKYDGLTIDCSSKFINIFSLRYLILMLLFCLFIFQN